LVVVIAVLVGCCVAAFQGDFTSTVPVTLFASRSGLVMEPGAKVKLHGVEVGRVDRISLSGRQAELALAIQPSMLGRIPGNVEAEIRPTTVFGAKYVELTAPASGSVGHLTKGAQIYTRDVTTEINTVFENLTGLMDQIQPDKLNATLTAIADGLRGRGTQLGETFSDADHALKRLNPQLPQLQSDLRATAAVGTTLGDAGGDLVATLRQGSVTSQTVTDRRSDLAALLSSVNGLGSTGNAVLGENGQRFVNTLRLLDPTTTLLAKYSPEYACMLQLGQRDAERESAGVDVTNYSISLDVGLLLGDQPYKNPENLPKVAAQGGPHGAPGCYPAVDWNHYPAPYLRMNTGAAEHGPGADRVQPGMPAIIEYLYGNALAGRGRP
jgi:phospholipid/cholesterol/gamma-HCH transport system substrate-binding protein